MARPSRYRDASGKRYQATRFDWLKPVNSEAGDEIRIQARRNNAYFEDKPVARMKPPFITKKTNIFTMGSCFAQEVRRHLAGNGFNVHSVGNENLDASLIWYNAFSILDEFKRVTGEWTQTASDIWDTKRGWQDPYRRAVWAPTPDKLWQRINYINGEMERGIKEAELVVITLGMTEVWFRSHTGKAVCAAPGYMGGGGEPLVEAFKATNYVDNFLALRGIKERLHQINPNAKLMFTVSPVPITVTFRGIDHAIANAESKSILRAAVGEVCAWPGDHEPGPLYFHSYEYATLQKTRDLAYKRDGRHVQPAMIESIMGEFERHFVVEGDRTDA